jgi:rhamnulokinase
LVFSILFFLGVLGASVANFPPMPHTLLAFDLGATSGRAIAGRFQNDGRLTIQELHRFPNEPVGVWDDHGGSLHWDILSVWAQMRAALASLPSQGIDRLDSIGVDTWGVDYALLGEGYVLLENPYHYRDRRTDGVMDRVIARLGRDKIYGITGIQFMPINTLYQLVAADKRTPDLLSSANALVTIPDLLNYWLTGRVACEYTNATTTQFLDSSTHQWSRELLGTLGLPVHFLAPVIEPGTVLGSLVRDLARLPGLSATKVVAPACHDTGSAVAAVRAGGDTAFLSSGTWSLLGTEVSEAVAGPDAQRLNFTNEGGVCGTVRLLKNITGMWLLEGCRKSWERAGRSYEWDALLGMSAPEPPFRHLVDPDDASFTRPDDMTAAVALYCTRTGQSAPETPGAFVRAVLESLALKYRVVLEQLESLTGIGVKQIRVIGGGSQNALLNQFTADATGRTVIAGPAEATALGNLAMQMVGMRMVESLDAARDLIEHSFPPRRFEPAGSAAWDDAYRSFKDLLKTTS